MKNIQKKKGFETNIIGGHIKKIIENEFPGLKVEFHHGPPGAKAVIPKLKYCEENKKSLYRNLAKVDIGIYDPLRKKVIMIIEIEEHQLSPKAIIGDICNIFFAEYIQIGAEDGDDPYSIENVELLLALTRNENDVTRQTAIRNSIEYVISQPHRRNIVVDIQNYKISELQNALTV